MVSIHVLIASRINPPGAEALASIATKGAIFLMSRARLLILPEVMRHVHHAPPRLHTGIVTSAHSLGLSFAASLLPQHTLELTVTQHGHQLLQYYPASFD